MCLLSVSLPCEAYVDKHPRDRYLTVFGRKPVREALTQSRLSFGELLIDRRLKRDAVADIVKVAELRGIKPIYCEQKKVNRRSRSPKQDQGVALDIETPQVQQLAHWGRLRKDGDLLITDGVSTPGNVGMMIRSAAAAGMSGLVLPERNCPRLGPLVIKASAGTVFHCPILKSEDTEGAIKVLKNAGWHICALDARGSAELFTMTAHRRTAWVLGNETDGISEPVRDLVDTWVSIPMAAGVESLNVAMAASIVAFETVRRKRLD